MPHIDFSLINYKAVLVAAVATFILGGAWYQALFGQAWIKAHGYSAEQVAQMRAQRPMPVFLGMMLICYLVIALVMAVIFLQFDIHLWSTRAKVGLAIWIIVTCVAMTGHIASKPISKCQASWMPRYSS